MALGGFVVFVSASRFHSLVCCRTTQQRSREEEIPFVGTKCSTTAPAKFVCCSLHVLTLSGRARTSDNE